MDASFEPAMYEVRADSDSLAFERTVVLNKELFCWQSARALGLHLERFISGPLIRDCTRGMSWDQCQWIIICPALLRDVFFTGCCL